MISKIKTLYRGRKAIMGLLKHKAFGTRIPVRVNLLITKFCNLSCFYCYAKDILNSNDVREPSLADLKHIIDQIYNEGCRWINILGGEPLLRNDIEEFIDYVRSKGMFIEITTNGCFIKKRINAMKKVDHLCISLDGDKKSNDKNRGEGSFEKIIEGIEYAVAHGIKVRVHATLCKRSMSKNSLEFLSNLCNRLQIKLIIRERPAGH